MKKWNIFHTGVYLYITLNENGWALETHFDFFFDALNITYLKHDAIYLSDPLPKKQTQKLRLNIFRVDSKDVIRDFS